MFLVAEEASGATGVSSLFFGFVLLLMGVCLALLLRSLMLACVFMVPGRAFRNFPKAVRSKVMRGGKVC